MAEQRNESFLNGLEERTASFTDEEFASARPIHTGMFMRSTMPELRGRDQ